DRGRRQPHMSRSSTARRSYFVGTPSSGPAARSPRSPGDIFLRVQSVLWVSEPLVRPLRERLSSAGSQPVIATTSEQFFNALDFRTVAFVDASTIAEVPMTASVPVIAICDETLPAAVGW